MADLPDKTSASTDSVASILTALSHMPKEVMRQFLDVVVRGVGTVYEPFGIAITARSKRFAVEQEAKAIVEREKILGEIKVNSALVNALLDSLRALPPVERLKFSEDLLNSCKLST